MRIARRRLLLLVCALLPALVAPVRSLAQEARTDPSLLGAGVTGNPSPATGGLGATIGAPTQRVDVLRSNDSSPVPSSRGPAEFLAPVPTPVPTPTQFQRFVATSIGSTLPIFGHSFFSAPPSTFAPVTELAPASDYVVGPGDELRVRGWGQVDIDITTVVTREGTISIPRVGTLPVAGLKHQELAGAVKAAVGKLYRNFDVAVSLGRLRSIQVFVVGAAARPGLYTVSSLSTLLNAVFASGGPSPYGSMRRIELRRGDALVGKLDVYDLLLKGDKSRDLRLQAGDVIFIPPVGPVAGVGGAVKSPAVFELSGSETTLGELIGYAGGTTTTADTRGIKLERIDPKVGRVVQALPWTDPALLTPLRDGDLAILTSVSQRFENAVTLRGNVAFPFRTEWKKGLTVSDLIPDRRILIPETYWNRTVALGAETPRSDVSRPADPSPTLRIDVENLLGEVNWSYATIERLDPQTLEARLLPFNLRKAIIERGGSDDLLLEPGDIVTIYSQRDVLPPAETRSQLVRVEGEVSTPGIYQMRPGQNLRQLVARAGGLTKDSYLFGTEFTRETVRKEQQARLNEVAARAEVELERAATARLARATSPEDSSAARAQFEQQRMAVARMRGLKATGRIVLDVGPDARSVDDLPELVLEDGDRLFIPARYSQVGVFGAVYVQSNFAYRPGARLGDYLSQAGGPTSSADNGSTYVLRANGSVFSRRHVGLFGSFDGKELMPNDAIVVPEDYNPTSWIRELKDWSQVFFNFGLGVAALKVLFP